MKKEIIIAIGLTAIFLFLFAFAGYSIGRMSGWFEGYSDCQQHQIRMMKIENGR